jgi:hypothetical protein
MDLVKGVYKTLYKIGLMSNTLDTWDYVNPLQNALLLAIRE